MFENENRPIVREKNSRKAQTDKDFKKTLADTPKADLGQLGGDRLLEDVEFKVVNPDELTEEQLDSVVGGKGPRQSCYM